MAQDADRNYPYDDQVDTGEAQWREIFPQSGVLAGVGGELLVSPGVGRQVLVASGAMRILGQVGYWDSQSALSLNPNTSGQPRIDRIIARNDFNANLFQLDVLQGTPGAAPVGVALAQTSSMHEKLLAEFGAFNGFTSVSPLTLTPMRCLLPPFGGPPAFDNTEARDFWIPTPKRGMDGYLADWGSLTRHDGTAWQLAGGVAPHVLVANPTTHNFAAGSSVALKFNSEVRDSYGAYDLASGVFTAPYAGVYDVEFSTVHPDNDNVMVAHQLTWGATTFTLARFNPLAVGGGTGGDSIVMSSSTSVYVTAGQTITPKAVFSVTRNSQTIENELAINWTHL